MQHEQDKYIHNSEARNQPYKRTLTDITRLTYNIAVDLYFSNYK